MFIRLQIQAHDALKKIMLDGGHAPLLEHTTRRIYDIIKTAETNEAFANSFDWECAEAFDRHTAKGYDDLVMLVAEDDLMPEDLLDLLTRYNIIKED